LFRLPGPKPPSAAAGRKPDLIAFTPGDANCVGGRVEAKVEAADG
jgi:hypothetical protein